jgi:[acyl-carrier-protein] S-malonyltransferase
MSGHSLGEYSALVASNSIDFFETLELVRRRGILMESASKGSMAAIMGLEKSILEGLCTNEQNLNNSTVSCANLNSPMQIVISGTVDAVTNVCNLAKEAGAKRAILLNVSVASHCMLMQKPAEEFNNYLNKISICMPNTNILQNFSGEVSDSEEMIKENLINQLTGSVKWMDIMKKVKTTNSIVIECGPGKVLQGIGRSNGLSDILNTSAENFNSRLEELL